MTSFPAGRPIEGDLYAGLHQKRRRTFELHLESYLRILAGLGIFKGGITGCCSQIGQRRAGVSRSSNRWCFEDRDRGGGIWSTQYAEAILSSN